MRKELYELYKEQHPEELANIGRLFSYTQSVEVVRAHKRQQKLQKVRKWEEILNGENRSDS